MDTTLIDRVQLFQSRGFAETAAALLRDAHVMPVVNLEREPVGYLVEHVSGEARLSTEGEWI